MVERKKSEEGPHSFMKRQWKTFCIKENGSTNPVANLTFCQSLHLMQKMMPQMAPQSQLILAIMMPGGCQVHRMMIKKIDFNYIFMTSAPVYIICTFKKNKHLEMEWDNYVEQNSKKQHLKRSYSQSQN